LGDPARPVDDKLRQFTIVMLESTFAVRGFSFLLMGCRAAVSRLAFPSVRLGRRLLIAAFAFLPLAAGARVSVDAPAPLDELLEHNLTAPSGEAGEAALEAFRRDAQKNAAELLATEGYFSPVIEVRAEPGQLTVTISPGPRTVVGELAIEIRGDIPDDRRKALLAAWPLASGAPFRDADWREAKQVLLRRLLEVDYPTARLADSQVEVDPATNRASLHAVYDTGPRYLFGELKISGLSRYSEELVRRYSSIQPGTPYNEKQLLELQTALQRTPYFSSVSVEIAQGEQPPEGTPPSGPVQAPVEVHVEEQAPHRITLGVGVSSNTGYQTEVIYQGYDFLNRAWQLETGLRLEQVRTSVYSDIRLPPVGDQRDSFGVLVDREDIQSLKLRRIALGAVRTQAHGPVEARYALNWQHELSEPQDAEATEAVALTLDGTWTLRRVDALLNPRSGFVAQFQAGGGAKALLSDQNFLRLRARYQHFFPVAERDVFSLRGELGRTLAPSRDGIPQDFLFRTGGAQSVRGYDYQSLGVKDGDAVVGGRYLAVASAEYTHWFDAKWGAATFVDAGDAADDRHDLDWAVGYGIGARYRSPAGPLGVDLAYGERERQVRVHFSLAIAF
jgi:translocation and assembly module TamA